MSNAKMVQILKELQALVRDTLRDRPEADIDQVIHEFLASKNLTATEHLGILDRLQELPK